MNPIVYFTKDISSKKIVEIYEKLGVELKGKVALKLHSGEDGNQNYLKPEFYKDIVEKLNATVVECNTAYEGERNSTDKHKKLIEKHGWDKYYNVDLMDAEGPDDVLEVKNGFVLKENYVGKNMKNYDSMLVVSHFKGHPMGGYGGALKQLSIGCASSEGKAWIHSAGRTKDQFDLWDKLPEQDRFLESMADAASTIVDHFKGQILFISVMKNMSVDCDCCAVAEDPCMKDIGILASTDPVALDQACIDLVNKSDDPGKEHFLERVNSRHGTYTIECAEKLGVGSTKYELVEF
jgi:uncharacterized Fe-S center protein